MVILMLLAAAAQAADLLTFIPAIIKYPTGELNPLVNDIMNRAGILGVAGFKAVLILVVLLACSAIWSLGYVWVATVVLIFCIIIGLFGAATNVWALAL